MTNPRGEPSAGEAHGQSPRRASSRHATRARHVVLAGLCAAAAIAYLSRNCISVAELTIRDELGVNRVQMGWIMSAFFIGYAVFQIPAGSLANVWGSRRALPVYALVWSAATAWMAMATGYWSLLTSRLVCGVSQAGLFPGCVNTISHWIPASRTALACGALASFMSVGAAIATLLTGRLLDGGPWLGIDFPALPWRWIFAMCAVPGLLWAAGFHRWFRDRPDQHAAVNQAELDAIRGQADRSAVEGSKHVELRESTPWAAILTSSDMWLICGQQFFRAAGYVFYSTWFPTFLITTRGVSTADAGVLASLPLLAVVAGSPLGGVAVDWTFNRTGSLRLSRQGIAIFAMLGCAAFISSAYFVDHAMTAVLLITAGSFCAALAGPCGYVITIDKGGNHVATVFSTMNMAGNIAAALCPVIVAWIVELTGSWNLVLFFFAGIYAAAAVCWGLLNPSGTVGKKMTNDE